MSHYRVSRSAKAELDEIWIALAQAESVEYASRIVDEFISVFRMLGAMPQSGRSRPEIGLEMRSFPAGDYVVYYRKSKRGSIQISHVIHAKRDQMKALKGARGQGSKHN